MKQSTITTTTLCKRFSFNASHYYSIKHFSAEQNQQLFGRLSNPQGHGHQYMLDICLTGPVDDTTGMIINYDTLQTVVAGLLNTLNYTLLNTDIEHFKTVIPTTENISHYCFNQLEPQLKTLGLVLSSVCVFEDDTLFAQTTTHSLSDDSMPATLYTSFYRQYSFSAAHRLWQPQLSAEENQALFGPCVQIHGHNYQVTIEIAGPIDDTTGSVYPLETLDQLVQEHLLAHVDHQFLDETVPMLKGKLSTAEVVGQTLFDILAPYIQLPAKLQSLKLAESPENWVVIKAKHNE